MTPDSVLVTGATGSVGSALVPELLRRGHGVRALVRDPSRAALPHAVDVHAGDAISGSGLAAALDGCSTAYYLIHSMGRGGTDDFAERDRGRRRTSARRRVPPVSARRSISAGSASDSEHLRSRQRSPSCCASACPHLVHVRAAMVIGPGSASFVMLRRSSSGCRSWSPALGRHAHAADRLRDVVAALASTGEPRAAGGDPARRRRRADLP